MGSLLQVLLWLITAHALEMKAFIRTRARPYTNSYIWQQTSPLVIANKADHGRDIRGALWLRPTQVTPGLIVHTHTLW